MKFPHFVVSLLFTALVFACFAEAQKRPAASKRYQGPTVNRREGAGSAVVIDETLSVLRETPSLFSQPVQRMRRGRRVQILGSREADGITFLKVAALPSGSGWVQADAVFGNFRKGDEERLARLVQASDGFDQLEIATEFLDLYPRSALRPSILLLFGDVVEEAAVKLSRDASNRLSRREMAATAAPLHSYFLNFVSLDRYRKLGIVFQFNSSNRTFHYDGKSWAEVAAKFPQSPEAAEAQKRLDALKLKMEIVEKK
jgi:hypothetical protein